MANGRKGRKQSDVFVLGEESLTDEPIGGESDSVADPEMAISAASDPAGAFPVPPVGGPGSAQAGIRRFAVIGLGAAAAATFGALELSGAGPPHPQHPQTSSRPPLVSNPAPSAAAPLSLAAPARPSAPRHEPRPHHHPVLRRPREIHHSEPVRELTPEQAPVSSPVEVPLPPPPVASPAPVPAPAPSPPPAPAGGGSAVEQEFGFER